MAAWLDLIHAARLSVTAVVIDVDRLVVHLMCMSSAVSIVLMTFAAWFFLSDQPRQRYR